MVVNRVFEISGELKAELVLTIMPNASRVSFYYRIQSMALEAEGCHFGDFVIAGGTMSFQNDNLWCHQG